MDYKKMLDRLDWWLAHDRKMQDAMYAYTKVVAPGSHGPVLDNTGAQGFIEGVSFRNDALKESLQYYAYEAPEMKDTATITHLTSGKSWNAKNKEEFIDYLKFVYGKDKMQP